MPLSKICGICSLTDAEKSVELGADFLGFIFAESPRKIAPSDARLIRRKLGSATKLVGVFKDHEPQFVNDTADALRLDFVQLHGQESADYCKQINHPIIKAIAVDPANSEDQLSHNLHDYGVHAFLFDRPKILSNDETWLATVVDQCREKFDRWRPYFIAGGLTAENLHLALSLDPYGVDIASGVEESAGVKNHKKLEEFFGAMKGKKSC